MTKQFFYPFIVFILFFALISCSDNVKFNNPAFEGDKDNVFWRALDSKATLVNGILTIEGFTRNEKLTLVMPSPNTLITQKDKASYVTYVLGTKDQTIMSSFIASVGTLNSTIYQTLAKPGPVNKVLISSSGLGYTSTTTTTSGGTGLGLKVNIEVTSTGAISALSVTSPGSGYTSGDEITVLGGDGNAKLIVQNVSNSNGEIIITGFDGVGKIVSGTFKFNAVNVNNDPLVESTVRFQYGNFYIPLK